MKKKFVKHAILCIFMCSTMVLCSGCKTDEVEPEQESKEKVESVDKTEWSRTGILSAEEKDAWVASIKASETLAPASIERVAKINMPGDMTAGQGGYTNGKYYFQSFIQRDTPSGEANNMDRIQKINLETGEVEMESENMALNHCNDITYNEKLGYLVVCHNNPYRNCISFIDPDDLSLVETIAIDYYLWSIDYNPTTDRYVVGLSGGQKFRILDSEFQAVGEEIQPTSLTKSSTTQGVTSDDDFIYFVYYRPNVMAIYDWDGNLVATSSLESKYSGNIWEPENLIVVGNEIYIGFKQNITNQMHFVKITGFVPDTTTTE